MGWVDELTKSLQLKLDHLSDTALRKAFEHICLLYDSAYDFLGDGDMIDSVFSEVRQNGGRTRYFVKAAVEALDLQRIQNKSGQGELL